MPPTLHYTQLITLLMPQTGHQCLRGGAHRQHPDMSRPRHGQHAPLVHVRHGCRAAPHGHQRLLQPPHLPVCRAALQGDAVWDAGTQVWIFNGLNPILMLMMISELKRRRSPGPWWPGWGASRRRGRRRWWWRWWRTPGTLTTTTCPSQVSRWLSWLSVT